jgi:hypothetical protein
MLLTKISSINVPSIFQSQFNYLSRYLVAMIQQQNNTRHDEAPEYFYEEFCEFVSEFYASLETKNLTYTTRIVEQFYSRCFESSQFPDKLNATLEHAITAGISALIIFHLAVQLAYITHYSLNVSCGLTLLSITVGIKITTPEWCSVGTLSGGFFKCSIFKSHTSMGKKDRVFSHR